MSHRQLIGVSGATATEFLQGLITNDMNLLAAASTKKNPFLFSLFLNAKGRTLTDAFIYSLPPARSSQGHSRYLIECDSQVRDQLRKLLVVYNLRKKVEIWKEDDIDVWSVLPNCPSHLLTEKSSWSEKEVSSDKLLFYAADPRAVPGWSGRVLLQAGSDAFQVFQPSTQSYVDGEIAEDLYTSARYRLGLPEGPRELKAGDGLPLEANADLMGAVSFSKGCYIGQELTTRTHFTGVIRRRMMPVVVASPVDASRAVPDAPIYRLAATGKRQGQRPIGWLRGVARRTVTDSHDQQLGIALLRLSETADSIKSGDLLWCRPNTTDPLPDEATEVENLEEGVILRPFAPSWWPKDIAPDLPTNLQ
ncbi:hypothetical protein AAHC03_020713 [Spirometra sp. Aus1]